MPYETRCKTGRKVQKFVPRIRVRIFRNERTRFFHLDPKLMFWCVFVLFGCKIWTVWLPYESRCTTGRSSAKVRATKSHRNFSQRTHRSTPLDPILIFWCVSYNLDPKLMFWYVSNYLGEFGTIWFHSEIRCKTDRTCAKVRATKSRRNFSQRTHPIQPIGP